MEKIDRRVRKTRALLLQGLVKMLETHDIQDISVKELTELVDINRGTFYLHYDDIYDMLHKIEDEMFLEFNEIMEQKPVVTNSLASTWPGLGFFHFLESAQSDANYKYLCSFIITGCVGVVETWLKESNPQSPEEMAEILGAMLLRQLNFAPGPA